MMVEIVLPVILTVLLARAKGYVQGVLLDFTLRKIKLEENADHAQALVSPAKENITIACLAYLDSLLQDGNVEIIQELNLPLSSVFHLMLFLVTLISLLARLLRY